MISYTDNLTSTKYTFIPNPNDNWTNNITINQQIMSNDNNIKYKSKITNIEGELIIQSNIEKVNHEFEIIPETFEQYNNFISSRDFKKEQWVYNILDEKDEQESILYRDKDILIIPSYTSNNDTDTKSIHLLAFVQDKSIRSLRDLGSQHINLLTHIKNKLFEIANSKYLINSNKLKLFVHYPPSAYQFHVHCVNIGLNDSRSSCEYSYNLSTIIQTLEIKSDFYQSIIIDKLDKLK